MCAMEVEEEEEEDEDNTWAVLVDSGYQGLAALVRSMGPFKRTAGHDLTVAQRNYNQRLAGERVICERWYGRLKTRHRIMASKYRNDRDDYGIYFKICAALTNYHVIKSHLY